MKTFKPEKINKIIFKISGEILAGNKGFGIDFETVESIADEITNVKKLGYSIGVVLGGGNFFRGLSKLGKKMRRVAADDVGMLATIQNAIIFSDVLNQKNYQTEVYSSIQVEKIAKYYTPNRAIRSLNEGKICFFCAGTGNPFFTTDTAAVLRAIEVDADIVCKGTKVDGVYTNDPIKDKNAKFIQDVTFEEAIEKKLKIMDITAFSLAQENDMSIKVFNITKSGNLLEAITRKEIGTFVHSK